MGDFSESIQAQLKDTYRIIGQIGEGGGGTIYKAYHKRLQKEVVIKKMHMKSGNELKNRQEADILKNLRHSYLPQVLDFIEAGNEVYTVIDFIPGESFQQLLDRKVKFSQDRILKYAKQLCEALIYLHGQQIPILHGDIKPANIMLTPEDNVCLIDFNISGFFEQNELMAIGYSKGYAAPEQKALVLEMQKKIQQPPNGREMSCYTDKDSTVTIGLDSGTALLENDTETAFLDTTMSSIFVDNPEHQIDIRSDIYSLGATLYHLLCGKRPSDNGESDLTYEELSELSSEAFAYILTTAMAYKKEDRFQSAEKMLEALKQIAKLDSRYKRLLFQQRMELLFSFTVFLFGIVLIFSGLKISYSERENLYGSYITEMVTAIEAFDKDTFEKNYEACISLNKSDPRAYYERAVWLFKNGNYNDCGEYIRQLFSEHQFNDQVTIANLYLLLGNCYYEENDYQNAVNALQTALKYDGQNEAIYRDLAIACAEMGNSTEAQEILNMAVDNHLGEDEIYLVQGEIAKSENDLELAREKFKECLIITKDDYIRTRAYVFYSDLDRNSTEALLDSADMLEKGIKELPLGSTGILYERLAQIYINLEANTSDLQYSEKAIQVFLSIIDNGAASYQTYINLTILYEQIKEFEKAHEMIEKAIDLYGDNYISYKRLAFLEVDEQAGKDTAERDYQEFKRNYQKALELYQTAGVEDSEMTLLEKVYDELVQANWL